MLYGHTDHKRTFCSMRMRQNVPISMKKTAKNGRFFLVI